MASVDFINECKNGANANRLAKFNLGDLEVNQSNYLQSITTNESIYNDGSIIGTLCNNKVEVNLLNVPSNTFNLTTDLTYQEGITYYALIDGEYVNLDEADDDLKQEYNYEIGETIPEDVYVATPFKIANQIFTPQIGIKYSPSSSEYISLSSAQIEEVKDTQTSKQTSFVAYGGGAILDKIYQCNLDFEPTYIQTSDTNFINGIDYYKRYSKVENNETIYYFVKLEPNLDYEVGDEISELLFNAIFPTHTILEFYNDACLQLGLTPTDDSFTNSEITLSGNPFTNNESLRIVIQEVEKVSCTIARIDWANHTITLGWLSTTIDYTFDTGDYSNLTGSLAKYGPVNKIVLGNSQLEGENVSLSDTQSILENGETQCVIDASYFLYTQDLRAHAIQGIYDKLDGLTYYDIELTTYYGKPFLEVGNKIQIVTTDNNVYDTYVLDHTFTFDGSFKSIIKSPALTGEAQKYTNELGSSSITSRVRHTELVVDKANQTITSTISTLQGTTARLSQLKQTVDKIAALFQATGGSNLIRNSQFLFADETWAFVDNSSGNSYHTELGNSYNGALSGITVSSAEIVLKNYKIVSALKGDTDGSLDNITGLIEGREYTLNFNYTSDPNTTSTIKMYSSDNNDIIDLPLTTLNSNVTMEHFTYKFTARASNYRLEIDTTTSVTSDSGYLHIYDLMLNLGDEMAWELSQAEIYSTVVQMSLLGLIVNMAGANVQTQMTADGFYVRKISDNSVVSNFDDDGLNTLKATTKQLDIKYDNSAEYVMKEMLLNNVVHHIEYFDLED